MRVLCPAALCCAALISGSAAFAPSCSRVALSANSIAATWLNKMHRCTALIHLLYTAQWCSAEPVAGPCSAKHLDALAVTTHSQTNQSQTVKGLPSVFSKQKQTGRKGRILELPRYAPDSNSLRSNNTQPASSVWAGGRAASQECVGYALPECLARMVRGRASWQGTAAAPSLRPMVSTQNKLFDSISSPSSSSSSWSSWSSWSSPSWLSGGGGRLVLGSSEQTLLWRTLPRGFLRFERNE